MLLNIQNPQFETYIFEECLKIMFGQSRYDSIGFFVWILGMVRNIVNNVEKKDIRLLLYLYIFLITFKFYIF